MKENFKTDFVNTSENFKPASATEATKLFDKATKIGVFKELHKKGLLSDYEVAALIAKQDKNS